MTRFVRRHRTLLSLRRVSSASWVWLLPRKGFHLMGHTAFLWTRQNPYVERLVGSLRRECLDYVIVFDELHLLRVLDRYFKYYHRSRCHLSLAGDSPQPRLVQGPELGSVVELPEVGGLHHRYERAAA